MERLLIYVMMMTVNKKKMSPHKFLLLLEAEIQLKPILDIFLRGFSLSSCPQQSLKVLLLLNPTCLLKYVLNWTEFFIFLSGLFDIRINCNRIGDGLM
jgi:hypothetical protein